MISNGNGFYYSKIFIEMVYTLNLTFFVLAEYIRLRQEMPLQSTKFYDQSSAVKAVHLWNALTMNIRKVQTISSFRKLVHVLHIINESDDLK